MRLPNESRNRARALESYTMPGSPECPYTAHRLNFDEPHSSVGKFPQRKKSLMPMRLGPQLRLWVVPTIDSELAAVGTELTAERGWIDRTYIYVIYKGIHSNKTADAVRASAIVATAHTSTGPLHVAASGRLWITTLELFLEEGPATSMCVLAPEAKRRLVIVNANEKPARVGFN